MEFGTLHIEVEDFICSIKQYLLLLLSLKRIALTDRRNTSHTIQMR